MRVTRDVRILDLTTLEPLESPFFEEEIAWKLEARGLLWRLRDDLSRPITPHDSERQYRPSQYACELALQAGFDGIAFPSAMGPGHNVVLF